MLAHVFRNSLVASGLLIGASLLIAPTASAQVVSGTVQDVNAVTFVGTTDTPITVGAAVAAYPLGTLTIGNNDPDGWTLTVASENGGKLENGDASESIVYTAVTSPTVIPGATITPVTLTVPDAAEPMIVATYSPEVAATLPGVSVTAAIAADQTYVPADTYSDTLTFTLTSN